MTYQIIKILRGAMPNLSKIRIDFSKLDIRRNLIYYNNNLVGFFNLEGCFYYNRNKVVKVVINDYVEPNFYYNDRLNYLIFLSTIKPEIEHYNFLYKQENLTFKNYKIMSELIKINTKYLDNSFKKIDTDMWLLKPNYLILYSTKKDRYYIIQDKITTPLAEVKTINELETLKNILL